MRRIRQRLQHDDGFTLVEIMVVVLIIAVLMAVAVPLFANFRRQAFDREAHVKLRNLYTIQQGYLVDHGEYIAWGEPIWWGWEEEIVANYEPTFLGLWDTGSFLYPHAQEYDDTTAPATRVCMAVQSKSGRFFVMNIVADTDVNPQPPRYGYTDKQGLWWSECLGGATLSTEPWS